MRSDSILLKGGDSMLNEDIRKLRKAKGLSQEELAVKLHVVRQTVSKWEKGLSVPDAETMMHIADALDTSVNVLLGAPVEKSEQDAARTAIASKLELLNEQFARQNERRRKIWRIVFIVISVIAAVMLVRFALDFFHYQAMMGALVGPNASESIIGGADGPTHIYVSNISSNTGAIIFAVILAAVAVVGIVKTRRR